MRIINFILTMPIVSIMTLSHNSTFGLIEVKGEKALLFLQGQLTANIQFSPANKVICALHCNPKGRILFSFMLFEYQSSIYIITLKSILPKVIVHLNRYAVLFRVNLLDQSNAFTLQFGIKKNPGMPDWNWSSNLTDHGIVIHNHQLLLFINERLDATVSNEITAAEWHGYTLRMGFPWINENTFEKFLPHELELQHTPVLSFEKGCYTGQEIIARLHYKGRVKTCLRAFLIDGFIDHSLQFYLDIDHSNEVFLVDAATYKSKTLICLLCNLEQSHFEKLYLSNHTVLPLLSMD